MRILVTGATGLVGRHVVARLVADGHGVTALARRVAHVAWPADVRAVAMNLLEPSALPDLVRGHDVVVHAAGPVAGAPDEPTLREVHLEGMLNLVGAAIDAELGSFVHVSSLAVHTKPARGEALDERTPLRGHFPAWMEYASAKREAELTLKWLAARGALRVRVLRPGIVLGAWDRHTTPRMLAALRRGLPVHIGSGAQRVPCVCAYDLADAVLAAVKQPFERHDSFVLAGPGSITQAELWGSHARAAGLAVPAGRIPERLAMLAAGALELTSAIVRKRSPITCFDVHALCADVSVNSQRAESILRWQPRTAYDDAVRAAVQHLNSPRPRPETLPQGGS